MYADLQKGASYFKFTITIRTPICNKKIEVRKGLEQKVGLIQRVSQQESNPRTNHNARSSFRNCHGTDHFNQQESRGGEGVANKSLQKGVEWT